MPMASIHKVGQGDLYHIHFYDQHAGHPGQGLPGQGGRPDQGLPGGGPVDPGYGRPGGGGGHPDHGLPGHGGIPGHELPDNPPPQVAPGHTLVLVRDQRGKWHYATIAPGNPPPRPVPGPGGERPDQGLPGQQPHPDQGLPGQGPNYPTGGPMPTPPMPTPQR